MTPQYTDEELIEQLHDLAEELGRSPSHDDMADAEDYPSTTPYTKQFGSWNQAKEEANLKTYEQGPPPQQRRSEDDEELLGFLVELADEEDRLTYKDLEAAEDYPSGSVYKDRFGTWNEAKEAAGLRTANKFTEDELIEYLQELDTEIEGHLTKSDLKAREEYPSAAIYGKHFGSWSKALQAARLVPDDIDL